MSDDVKNEESSQPEEETAEVATETEAPKKKKKRPKMTFREQMIEIRPLFIVLAIAGIGYGGYRLLPQYRAPTFMLTNQFGVETTVDFSGDQPSILIFADQEAGEQIEAWALKLAVVFGERITNYRIVNPGEVAPRMRPFLRLILQKRTEFPILLDYDGIVSKKYECVAGAANLFVVAPNGKIKARQNGEMTEQGWEITEKAIASLL